MAPVDVSSREGAQRRGDRDLETPVRAADEESSNHDVMDHRRPEAEGIVTVQRAGIDRGSVSP